MSNTSPEIDHIWDIAELLRGDYKRSDYGKVILPFTVLRRLDCILEPTKVEVLRAAPDALKRPERTAEAILNRIARQPFYNYSPFSFTNLLADPANLAANLLSYINGFSNNIREILEYFSFPIQIERLEKADLLYRVVERFRRVPLALDLVPTHAMGTIFEELIRRFSEQSNETAGEHFTPREVIKLIVNLLFCNDREGLTKQGVIRTLYDPACGTGGMLAVAEDYLRELNRDARLELFGQELNPESYAICKADMVIKGHNAANIKFGNSFTSDGLPDREFEYMLSNPPFGVEWKKVEKAIRDEHNGLGHAGRFGAGLPRISDGSLLFLQHMLSKRKRSEGGSRLAIVFNGSPLFSGGVGSGESEIRRWIIENDWLEAIIALPDQLFYNTGISTYIWIVTNNKTPARQGKIQLVNAVGFFRKKEKSLGNKRKELGDGEDGCDDHISTITRIYGEFTPGPYCKIFDNIDFGYHRVTIERPLRMNFQRTAERIRAVMSLNLPVETRRSAWVALTHGYRRPGIAAEPDQLATLLAPQAKEQDREAAWATLVSGLDESLFDTTQYRDKATFRENVLLPHYLKAGIKPPPPRAIQLILLALGERDEAAEAVKDQDDQSLLPDPELRDFENVRLHVEDDDPLVEIEITPNNESGASIYDEKVPLRRSVYEYFEHEVRRYIPDAWINTEVRDEQDGAVGKVGYELPFTRHFYEYTPLPDLATLEAEIVQLEYQIQGALRRVIV
ncbi:MAG: class I SAM-dependent DNA methyltransferase [Roseiflexaceae bacterium]|nr:class I SAM-dependent DNA methyltransferase [Roseiflexaceae bacterium]